MLSHSFQRLVSTNTRQLKSCPVRRQKISQGSRGRISAASRKEAVTTENAPTPLGPYSQAIKTDSMLFVSGQLGLVPEALKNLGAILEAGGSSFDNVVKTTVMVADMGDFANVNAVYEKYFSSNKPARALFAVKTLPLNSLVEVEAVALLD